MSEPKLSYSQLKAELEDILAKMTSQDIDIDEATKYFERGLNLINELEKQLKVADNKVRRIKLKPR